MSKNWIIARIESDMRVGSISDERSTGDGFWVYTQGFCRESLPSGEHREDVCLHIVHEDTPTKCWARMNELIRCDCAGHCNAGADPQACR